MGIKDENICKIIKFYAKYELYFEVVKGENGKGMIVDKIVDNKLSEYGISKGWKLSKLGKRNVIKSSFIMLKNQLMAQATTAKTKGYELTFIDGNKLSDLQPQNIVNKAVSAPIYGSTKQPMKSQNVIKKEPVPSIKKEPQQKVIKSENVSSDKKKINEVEPQKKETKPLQKNTKNDLLPSTKSD